MSSELPKKISKKAKKTGQMENLVLLSFLMFYLCLLSCETLNSEKKGPVE